MGMHEPCKRDRRTLLHDLKPARVSLPSAGWAIQRIRQFYMRKVKHTQTTWHDKLTTILDDFPKVCSGGWAAEHGWCVACCGLSGRNILKEAEGS